MRYMIYLLSGAIFAFGLSLSGMIDSKNVIAFLSVGTQDWDFGLFEVLMSAVAVYLTIFLILRRKGQTLLGQRFEHPKPRPVDKKLLAGAVIFGLGWGLAGLCPGPAIVNLTSLSAPVLVFVSAMFLGFEIQRRVVKS
jgi:uncharacterized membrane protein YedE/YeeE